MKASRGVLWFGCIVGYAAFLVYIYMIYDAVAANNPSLTLFGVMLAVMSAVFTLVCVTELIGEGP